MLVIFALASCYVGSRILCRASWCYVVVWSLAVFSKKHIMGVQKIWSLTIYVLSTPGACTLICNARSLGHGTHTYSTELYSYSASGYTPKVTNVAYALCLLNHMYAQNTLLKLDIN
jgi:hypothetical protein